MALILGCIATTALRATAACTAQQAETEEEASLRTWADLYHAYETYNRSCEEGVVGETLSDFVTRTLANHWSELPELKRLVSADPKFRSYVLSHIDATDDEKDLVRIARNANVDCPSGSRHLCAEIEHAALEAKREIDAIPGQ
jgi:hypothetical protein